VTDGGEPTLIQPGVLASAWRHRVLVAIIVGAFGLGAILLGVLRPSTYEALATIVLEDPGATLVLGTDQAVSGDRLVANQLEVVQSGLVATRAAELVNAAGHGLTPGEILSRSSFSTLRGTDVIVIGFSGPDPDEAEAVANSIVVAYDQVQREQRREANASVEARLDQADALLRSELASINEQIDLLRADRSLGLKIDQVLTRIAQLQQQLSETTDPETRELLISVLDQEDRQLEILRSAAEVESERADLAALIDSRDSVVFRLAEIETQRSDIELQTEIEGSGISFYSPAAAAEVSSGAGLIFTTLAGLFVGALVALGVAYTLSNWRRGFAAWDEPESLLGIPFLAEIPQFGADSETLFPVRDNPRSVTAEAFRFAAANIDFRLKGEVLKSVYVASAVTGDGKSTLVANIAAAAARTKKVLVIDADFGSQAVSKILVGDFSMHPGLTELTAGRIDIRAAVLPVPLSGGVELHLLGRGMERVTAPEFFGSSDFEGTIRDLSTTYDLIFIDGPPLLQVAYASTLSRLAGVTVVVIPHGASVRSGSELARRLHFLDTNVIGYIYNQAPLREVADSTGGSMRDILGDRGIVEPVRSRRSSRP
jgi:Mrp family chromosome partitioning ATPase/capsular polysaccharide biosynthesis protein